MTVADQAWVTLVVDGESAKKAIVLAKSLRRVLTSRKVVAVISPGISSHIRSVLDEVFDSTFTFSQDTGSVISKEVYGKIYCWNLPVFRKCVFLESSCFVLRNCDEIFSTDTDTSFHAPLDSNGNLDLSVFVFSPAPKAYRSLVKFIDGTKGSQRKDSSDILSGFFGNWTKNQANAEPFAYDYIQKMSLSSGTLAINQKDLGIVSFIDEHPFSLMSKPKDVKDQKAEMGILEQSVLRLWTDIYTNEVEPIVQENHKQNLQQVGQTIEQNCFYIPSVEEELMKCAQEPIAIVGMSCRYPGANNLPEFWNLLLEGRDGIRVVSPDRWRKDQGCHMTAEQKTTQAGFLSCPVDEFDGKFFGISPMEMSFLDPQQRLMLEVIWESLEEGGIDPTSLKNTYTGIFIGEWTNDYKELIREQNNKEFYRTYMGNSPGSAAGRISFILGMTGPSVATESGCSSAMVAVDLACKSLRMGESTMALACGVNLLLHPFSTKDMVMVCAPDGHCKTFSSDADGFGRAEGCGSLVLKRYSDAINSGDKIWGLIRGMGTAQEGPSRSLGTPTVHCEAMAMQMALNKSGIHPNQISYVETHGTGTPVGDPMEVAAIAQVYSKEREQPLVIGSVKTNVGHTESCSGITGIMKVVLSMQNQIIPQHRNFVSLNPHIKLESVPAEIPLEAKKWEKKQGVSRYAGVSSFGITGTDAHAIIQETPDVSNPQLIVEMERPLHTLTVSAKSEAALDELLKHYEELLSKDDTLNLADVAYTANTGRAHFQQRVAITGKTTEDIVKKIENAAYLRQQIPDTKSKVCFLFTGQGSQYPGMAKSLYNSSPVFRMNFDKCESLLREKYQVNIKAALWGDENQNISRTIYSQTSIFCVEYCLTKVWESYGIKPDCVLGHSLGEFAAACAAGILDLEGAMELVAQRSRMIDNLPRGKMVAIKTGPKTIDPMIASYVKNHPDKPLDYAAVNSNDQVVLAGSQEAIEGFALLCTNNNLKTHVLEATHAFHSRHMEPMLPEYLKVASQVQYNTPTCTYISGMDGKLLEDGDMVANYWVRHTRESVKFLEASKVAFNEGSRIFLEVGPQPVLSALTMVNCGDFGEPIACLPSLRKNEEEWITMLNTLGKLYVNGMDINWKNFDQYLPRSKVTLPFYPFQRKSFWFEPKVHTGGMMNGTEIHPLIGCPLPNASSLKMYQTCIDLKKETYIKDHCIGNKVIFPGAGYMEMILAAGHATTQCSTEALPVPGTPLTVENLMIEAPLCISETEACEIQVMVSTEDMTSAGYKISIHRRINSSDASNSKWLKHAHAEFSPFAVNYTNNPEDFPGIKQRCGEDVQISEFYDKLSTIGLKFGDTFRSIKAVWKGDKELLGEIAVPEKSNEYLCHPVVIDAMIQALMLSRNQKVEKLIVPITIKKFIWLAKSESQTYFVHCRQDTEGPADAVQAVLFDDQGKKLAVMCGAELIETSVDVILSALEQQKLSLPNLYEEAWRSTMGPLQNRVQLPPGDMETLVYQDPAGNPIKYSYDHGEVQQRVIELTDQMSYSYIVQGLYELGWEPKIGDQIELKHFLVKHQIMETHYKFFKSLFNGMFLEEQLLKPIPSDSEDRWEIIGLPTPYDKIGAEIKKIQADMGIHQYKDKQLVAACGEVFGKIISGKESALAVLFPEDPTKLSVEMFYAESFGLVTVNQLGGDILRNILAVCQSKADGKEVLRILEIGGGTGSSTKTLLPIFDQSKIRYEYTFTDVSPIFFNKAAKTFEEHTKNMVYKVLNIDEDPKGQGFIPHHYDMVIASNVIHATKDLSVSVNNIRHLLRDNGLVCLVETNKPLRPVDLMFGVLEGYWKFTDHDIRPSHTIVSHDTWKAIMKNNGFSTTASIPVYDGQQSVIFGKASDISPAYKSPSTAEQISTWLLMSDDCNYSRFFQKKLENMNKNVVVVTQSTEFKKASSKYYNLRPSEKSDLEQLLIILQKEAGNKIEGIIYLWGINQERKDQDLIARAFLNLSQLLLDSKFKSFPRVYVLTQGIMPVVDQSPCNPSSGTLWGLSRSLRSEQANLTCRCIDFSMDDKSDEKVEELYSELWNEDGENQVAYRERQRFVIRIVPTKLSFTDLSLPNSQRFCLTLPVTKTIADLKFDVLGVTQLKETEIEVKVKAAGLNFKDVLNVLKPDAQFDNSNSVGADFAGIVSAIGPDVTKVKVGDKVVGCNFQSVPLPSHVQSYEDAVVPLPDRLTFAEGATLPAVFATAFYCLVKIGKLQKGETILLHTASGGVGICAIQIAQWIGAKVIATAGSKRKRSFLRSMGVEHVFHSRDLTFGAGIGQVTGGKGVDMVLNSLTSPGFKEMSLKSSSPNARFVEMSKLNIWKSEEVTEMRPDVEYTIVDLTAVSQDTWKMLFNHLKTFLEEEAFKPIPYVRFNAINIREALTYLQKAKHVGKVVCIMPEMVMESGEYVAKTPMFNDRSTYIITGGLGGIGMEVAKWMSSSGAQHVVLVGRSQPNEGTVKAIEQLKAAGMNVIVEHIDVGDFNQCREMIDRISCEDRGLPPVRGVMHAAGCLSDAIIVNQTWEKFQKTFNAKVNGGWNLHKLTLNYPLEHFMMFSSVVALFGPLGQSNHSAGNSFLDALAHYRIACGLPAISINWGQWGQVGIAAGIEVPGLIPFSPVQGITALEAVMKSQRSQIAVLEADFQAIRRLFPQTKKYAEELKLSAEGGVMVKISSEKFWEEYDSAEEDDKSGIVQLCIENILRQILKLDKNEVIDENQNLQEMGLDSLMMVEMKNFLQTLMGNRITVSASALQDCHTVVQLTDRLVDLIEGSADDTPVVALTKEELNELIQEDSTLPDHIKPTEIPHCIPSQMRTVFVTGGTGNLAPYVISYISALEHVEKIYCLVRPSKNTTGMERLLRALKDKSLTDSSKVDKIEAIEGNLGDPSFGLPTETYTKLSEEVDGIFHCAVKSNHIEKYGKSEKNKRDIRSINVGGTIRMLEFATTGKTKLVLHSSTMVAITKADEKGRLPENWPSPTDFNDLPNVGYAISKFICDRLIFQAVERGVPCKSMRFPGLTGHSETGYHTLQDNHLMLRVLSYMKMGIMPALPLPFQLLPVDTCAEASVKLFFNDECPFEVYNITNPKCPLEQEFVAVAKDFGYEVKMVEYQEFCTRLGEEGETSLLFPLRELYFNEDTFKTLSYSAHLMQSWLKANDNDYFRSAKLQKYIPEIVEEMEHPMVSVKKDLLYAKGQGVFAKFGLN